TQETRMDIASLKHVVSAEEWQLRLDLAACYRLVAMYGWSDLVFTHISARVPGPEHHFLINPYGLMFDEITASSLVKVDANCNHGLLTVGRTIPDAFLNMYTFENACRIQIDAQAGGELVHVDRRILQGLSQVMKTVTAGQGSNIAWPALLRKLDRTDPSYKT